MRTVLGVLGIVAVVAATSHPIGAQETPGGKADKNSKSWEAVAPGYVTRGSPNSFSGRVVWLQP